ncbi:hypothetical protein PAXRUDRAFT_19286 [Paxillus rubicundulus Ve08.2h10]|uniref:Uncharacterized protein n=1 Tax=Paxillus rubicundulus Ve08.2h10 TaxID=930991 RepID=A0A0D0BUJ9_9AGAM|nr:hypothetical protein PAXRUDRAFT_19286 [Paxillus rubicundulus Ve08.2h10]
MSLKDQANLTPAASESSWVTTWSKMEVVLPRGKGKKGSCQDLGDVPVAQSHAMGSLGTLAKRSQKWLKRPPLKFHDPSELLHLSVQPQPSAGSDDEKEVVIVVWAGKGKVVSAQVKGVTVDEGEFKEIMWQILICELKVWDTQAWSAELKGEVLGLKAYINCLCQKKFSCSMSPRALYS